MPNAIWETSLKYIRGPIEFKGGVKIYTYESVQDRSRDYIKIIRSTKWSTIAIKQSKLNNTI